MQWLEGKKTLIVAAVLGLATVLKTLGYIDEDTFQQVYGLFVAAGLVTIRQAVTTEAAKPVVVVPPPSESK